MDPQSPILVRLFKQEAELEVWKQDKTGRFALLKTYPICRWSGDLGPKVKEGDRQAPEGFYNITPGADEPEVAVLSVVQHGLPERLRPLARPHRRAPDGAWRLLVARLLRHDRRADLRNLRARRANPSSAARRSFQVQAYPFRMTPQNMAKHRNNPNMPFWKMLKQGNDHFEVTQLEPKVDVCEQRYVFNAEKEPNSTRPPAFSPAGKCPVYRRGRTTSRRRCRKSSARTSSRPPS